MRIIDLSTPVDAGVWEPNPIEHTVMSPAEGALHMAEAMRTKHDLDFDPAVLPGGELLSLDFLRLTSHTGTHVDAPSHYGSTAAYGRPRDVDELPLDWFVRPGVVLDISDAPVGTVDSDRLKLQFDRIDYTPRPMDVVLLHTGAARLSGTPAYFTDFTGLDRSATELLLDLGVRVIGTDAFSLDAPFGHMIREYQRTGDTGVLWPAHFLGREREYCQIERLNHLETLPAPTGFTVSCLPVKIRNAGAGWARAVAILPS
ncbi:cyclase family protein [Dactylosporangium aurantiacum]|uniref:Cyclase family protein n=1 Tax=Dactylosporangium aurantiacum TaxID=35754 RepID=A0A9Q9MDR6_9ACTN|nr:cyclase family protein [Dactylosporangium aurantiacum]MDG6101806.1 cyclase family protein [Dactylosporangium aurantiacum]UWZ52389.1 cyclase family protein [Dactylosporangium aurantiacum]